jgi:hypothetical protein
MLEAELQDNDEVMRLLEAAIRSSGFFRLEAIPGLASKLRGGSEPFARTNTKIAFDGDEILSVEEKRALGLNTRMKYSKAFIAYFDPKCLRTIEPKSALENMHLSAFHRVARKRELLGFRELGCVKKVRIVPVGDARDCGKIKRFKKTHDIDCARGRDRRGAVTRFGSSCTETRWRRSPAGWFRSTPPSAAATSRTPIGRLRESRTRWNRPHGCRHPRGRGFQRPCCSAIAAPVRLPAVQRTD